MYKIVKDKNCWDSLNKNEQVGTCAARYKNLLQSYSIKLCHINAATDKGLLNVKDKIIKLLGEKKGEYL